MIAQLNELLDYPAANTATTTTEYGRETNVISRCLCVTIVDAPEHASDGSFLLHHFLSMAIRQRAPCLLLSFSQTCLHYDSIQRQMGNAMLKRPASVGGAAPPAGRPVYFVDALTRLTHLYPEDAPFPPNVSAQPDAVFRLKQGFAYLREHVIGRWLEGVGMGAHVLVDDLNVPLDLGVDPGHVYMFLYALRLMLEEKHGRLVVLMHRDKEDTNTTEHPKVSQKILHSLLHDSHYILETRGLSTGYSRDIDGQIRLEKGGQWNPIDCGANFHPQSFHYRIDDASRIRIFGKGLATGTL